MTQRAQLPLHLHLEQVLSVYPFEFLDGARRDTFGAVVKRVLHTGSLYFAFPSLFASKPKNVPTARLLLSATEHVLQLPF